MFWQLNLQPASYAGVAFYVAERAQAGGRRLAKFEFPQRDDGYIEDLGKRLATYRVRGYVIGELYAAQRDALTTALNAAGPATLVDPYLGPLTVACDSYTMTESLEDGGRAVFDMQFVDASTSQPSPVSAPDTASQAFAAMETMAQVLAGNYALLLPFVAGTGIVPGIAVAAIGAALGGLATLAATVLAPLGTALLATVLPAFSTIAEAPSDPVQTPTLVLAAFSAAVTAGIAAANPPPVVYDPVLGDTSDPLATAVAVDPSYGLLTLAAWTPPAATGVFGAAQNQQQQALGALTALVQGAAVVAAAQVFAESDFTSANAAQAARASITAAIGAQAALAASLGSDALYLAWSACANAVSADLAARVLNLPLLTAYDVGGTLPAAVLAQRLYQDASRADELVALNGAIHPLFMPPNGLALSQ